MVRRTNARSAGRPKPGKFPLVVVGGSAGSVEVLIRMAALLPHALPAAVLCVVHVPAQSPSVLPQLLGRRSGLRARHAVDGEPLRRSTILVAPPDHHIAVEGAIVRVFRGARENGHRPAIDPLFRSAARQYGRRVIGVILSGTLDDGVAGLKTVAEHGGTTVVQDPREALFPQMPFAAIRQVEVDHVASSADLPHVIIDVVRSIASGRARPKRRAVRDGESDEAAAVLHALDEYENGGASGTTSILTCPECGGALWEFQDGRLLRYRCHVRHTYSPDSLVTMHGETAEKWIWYAIRSLQERALLSRRLASMAIDRRDGESAHQLQKRARDAERSAFVLKDLIEQLQRVGSQTAPVVAARPESADRTGPTPGTAKMLRDARSEAASLARAPGNAKPVGRARAKRE